MISIITNDSTFKISVAMCTYNGEKYLRDQLESILSQTMNVHEIVICDDGSFDDTLVIAREILSKAQVHYRIEVNPRCLGVTKNFEKSISLCTGEIIFLSDQDDIWKPNKVEKYVTAFQNNPNCVLAYSDADMLIDGQISQESFFDHIGFMRQSGSDDKCYCDQILRQRYSVNGCLMAVRKSFVEEIVPFYDSKAYHDCWIALNAPYFGDVQFIRERLSMYRLNPTSTTAGDADAFYRIVEQGTARERHFCINDYFCLRLSICEEVTRRHTISNAYNQRFASRLQLFVKYRTMLHKHIADSRLSLGFRILELYFIGGYYYRNANRGTRNGIFMQMKSLISDIIFLWKN